jgi:hypothetical protein
MRPGGVQRVQPQAAAAPDAAPKGLLPMMLTHRPVLEDARRMLLVKHKTVSPFGFDGCGARR